jgi:transposase
MLNQELALTIKVLKKQGMPTKAIAREFGVARNTVKKYLNQRIEDAKPDWNPAVVLYQEIQVLDYTGKIRILSSYIA